MSIIKQYVKIYFIGFTLAFLFLNLTMCPEESATKPEEEIPPTETTELKAFSESLITTFNSGNPQNVLNMMYDEHKEFFSEGLEENKGRMSNFASALQNRKLIVANELIAEYEITIDGKKYTVTFSNAGDGIWKLHRF